MKNTIISILAFSFVSALSAAPVVVDTVNFNRSENAEGVFIALDTDTLTVWDSSALWSLDSFTFQTGASNDGTLFLNVYSGFTDNTTVGTFVGSSSNSVLFSDTDTNGADVNYTFSGVNLAVDTSYAIVFSTTATSGSIVQPNLKSFNNSGTYDSSLVNLLAADVGDINGSDSAERITFSGELTVVPEPSSIALLGLAALAIVVTRFRKR